MQTEENRIEEPTIAETETVEKTPAFVEEVVSEPENATSDTGERVRLELDAYKRHFSALEEELKEIRQKYKEEDPLPPDPVSVLTGEVNSLKSGFEEIRQMLLERGQQQQQQVQQMQQPQGYAFFPPPMPQAMYQSPIIAPAPALPYITTPTPIPTNTQVPQINFNSNKNGNF